MGNLLVSPITEKETHRGQTSDGELTYAVSSMQGWRVHMEDAHICQPTLYAEERMVLPAANVPAASATAGTSSATAASTAASTAATSSPTTADVMTGATTSTTTLSSPSKRDGNAESNSNSNTAQGGLVKKAKTDNTTATSTTSTATSTATATATTQTNTTNTATATGTKVTYRKIDLPNHSLFAVFDGHGGSFAAQYSGLNFVRVLSRQPSFVQYAHFVHEQTTRDLMEKDATTSTATATTTTTTSSTTTTTTPNGNDETMTNHNHNDSNHNTNNNPTQNPAQQAQIHRKGLELLEQAFRDAFLDLDREIWRVVNHVKNKDCKLPSKSGNGVVRHQQQHDDDVGDVDVNNNDNDDDFNGNGEEEDDDDYDYSRQDSGTTAVAVMFTPQYIICANAGDSRSVYSKQGNCTIPLSYDHKPDDEEEERRIVEAGGFVRVGRVDGDLAVSRGLGDFRFKEYDLYRGMGTTSVADMPYLLNRGNGNGNHKRSRKRGGMSPGGGGGGGGDDYVEDAGMIYPDDQKVSPVPDIIVQKRDRENDEFVVIACDGIFDVQTNHECISMTAEIFQDGETDMGLLCEEMLDMCLEKGSKDNMTALVIKFPAQTVCEGGGVMKRRKSREQSGGSLEGP